MVLNLKKKIFFILAIAFLKMEQIRAFWQEANSGVFSTPDTWLSSRFRHAVIRTSALLARNQRLGQQNRGSEIQQCLQANQIAEIPSLVSLITSIRIDK